MHLYPICERTLCIVSGNLRKFSAGHVDYTCLSVRFHGLSLNRYKDEDFIAFISFIVVVGGLLAVNIFRLSRKVKTGLQQRYKFDRITICRSIDIVFPRNFNDLYLRAAIFARFCYSNHFRNP